MEVTPDALMRLEIGPIALNATIFFTWAIMALLVVASWLVSRRLTSDTRISRGQNILEVIVLGITQQIRDISDERAAPFVPFVGTLFLFVAVGNILSAVPHFESPAGSLSTTAALSICVFFAVHIYGIGSKGVFGYLRSYAQPTPIMLPFNIIGELSRTLALAVRLFGNVMSGTLILGVLLSLAPFIFPTVMQAFGLLTGLIQAYIFAVLSMVYIASAVRVHESEENTTHEALPEGG